MTSRLKETIDSVKKPLNDAYELASKQLLSGKQFVLMTDVSLRSTGYALMIDDKEDQKNQSKRRTDAFVAVRSKFISLAQLKTSVYSKHFLAMQMAFLEPAHILWERTKPTIVLTGKERIRRLFQAKAIPLSLWKACD